MECAFEDQDVIGGCMSLEDHLPSVLVGHRSREREPDMFEPRAGMTKQLLAESGVLRARQYMTLEGDVCRGRDRGGARRPPLARPLRGHGRRRERQTSE